VRGRTKRTTQGTPGAIWHSEGAHHTQRTRGSLPPVRWCDPRAGAPSEVREGGQHVSEFLFGVAQGAALALVVLAGLPLLAVRARPGARPRKQRTDKE
jgi:hypothetical protein